MTAALGSERLHRRNGGARRASMSDRRLNIRRHHRGWGSTAVGTDRQGAGRWGNGGHRCLV